MEGKREKVYGRLSHAVSETLHLQSIMGIIGTFHTLSHLAFRELAVFR